MRVVHVALLAALLCFCAAQEDVAKEPEAEGEAEAVTEPPRSLIRPRRPLKSVLSRPAGPATKIAEPEAEEQETTTTTTTAPTRKTTTKATPSRSRSSKTRATKAPVDEEAVSVTSTTRRSAKNRNRNRNRSRTRSTTTRVSTVGDEVETTTKAKNSKRRGSSSRRTTAAPERSSNGRRTTTSTTTASVGRGKTKASSAPRGTRKRTSTAKPELDEEVVATKVRKPSVGRTTSTPIPVTEPPVQATVGQPTAEDTSVEDDSPGGSPPKLAGPHIPRYPKPLATPVEGVIEHRPNIPPVAFTEIPVKRPLRPIPVEGAISEEPIETPEDNSSGSGGLKWEPVSVPPKLVGPLDRSREGLSVRRPGPKESESNDPLELSVPPLVPPRARLPRPLKIHDETSATEKLKGDSEESNAFPKSTQNSRPDGSGPIGVPPKPIGPVSYRQLLPKKDLESPTSSRPIAPRKVTDTSPEENDFHLVKPTSPKPKLLSPPRGSATTRQPARPPVKESKPPKDEEDPKTTKLPSRSKSTTSRFRDEGLHLNKEVAPTPYPLIFDDGTKVKSPKSPRSRSKPSAGAIFSPFEEDMYDENGSLKSTVNVFKLRDDSVSPQPQSLDEDEGFGTKPFKSHTPSVPSRKERPLSRSIPTPSSKLEDEEAVLVPALKPSRPVSPPPMTSPTKPITPNSKGKAVVDDDDTSKDSAIVPPEDDIAGRAFPAPVPVPPRSRYLTVTSDARSKEGDKAPPLQDDPFLVPTPDIGRFFPEDDELLVPARKRDEATAVPTKRRFDSIADFADTARSIPAEKAWKDEVDVLELKPVTRPSPDPEDDLESLALPPARKVLPAVPAQPKPQPKSIPVQISGPEDVPQPKPALFESPPFVIRRPVNLTNIEPAPEKVPSAVDDNRPLSLDYEPDPKSLKAALPPLKSQSPSPPSGLPDSVPSRQSQNPSKPAEVPKSGATPEPVGPDDEEGLDYEDEDYGV